MESIPAELKNSLPSFAAQFQTDIGRLFWRSVDDGFPDEGARLIATRRVKGKAYNLFLGSAPT